MVLIILLLLKKEKNIRSGSEKSLIKISPQELQKANKGQVVRIRKESLIENGYPWLTF